MFCCSFRWEQLQQSDVYATRRFCSQRAFFQSCLRSRAVCLQKLGAQWRRCLQGVFSFKVTQIFLIHRYVSSTGSLSEASGNTPGTGPNPLHPAEKESCIRSLGCLPLFSLRSYQLVAARIQQNIYSAPFCI